MRTVTFRNNIYKNEAELYQKRSLFTLTTSGIFPFFLARQPQGVLLHRYPPLKPCANENFPYPLVILRLGATLTRP
jgi:hypothetical protein